MAASPLTDSLPDLLAGAIGGATVTLVAFRTKLAMMARDTNELRKDMEQNRRDVDAVVSRIERRQLASLKLTADIARKVGVDGRVFDDALVRMLTEEE